MAKRWNRRGKLANPIDLVNSSYGRLFAMLKIGCHKWVTTNGLPQMETGYFALVLAFAFDIAFAPMFDIVIVFYI